MEKSKKSTPKIVPVHILYSDSYASIFFVQKALA